MGLVRTPEAPMAVLAPRRRWLGQSRYGVLSWRKVRRSWQLFAMLSLPLLWLLLFQYWPMYGVQIAFRNFNVIDGINGSPWVGLDNFQRFASSYNFWQIIQNTVILSVYSLVAGFPLPILLALALNHVNQQLFKKTVQMVGYAPEFISTVVMVGIIFVLLDPRMGMVNQLLGLIHIGPIDFMGTAAYFRHIFVWSGVWQHVGFACIIYLAALTSIDPTLHEAALMDGASKLQRIRDIDLPGIIPAAIVLLILDMSSILSIGFEKVLLMQNPINLQVSEVVDTYVYRVGLASPLPQFSYAAAIGLFQSIIALILIVLVNQLARRIEDASLW